MKCNFGSLDGIFFLIKIQFGVFTVLVFVVEVAMFVANELLYGKGVWNSSDDAFWKEVNNDNSTKNTHSLQLCWTALGCDVLETTEMGG